MSKWSLFPLTFVLALGACTAEISGGSSDPTAESTTADFELKKSRGRSQHVAGSGSTSVDDMSGATAGSGGSGGSGDAGSIGTAGSGSGVAGADASTTPTGSAAIAGSTGSTDTGSLGGAGEPAAATGSGADLPTAGTNGTAGSAPVPVEGDYAPYPALDLDDLAARTDPNCVPASPDLPVTTRSLDAANGNELAAAMTQGSATIRLTANIGLFNIPANTHDIEVVVPQGLRLGPVYFGNPGIARMRFRGPGEVVGGLVIDRSGATDIVFDGVRMTGQSAGGNLAMWDLRDMKRVAWVNSVGRAGTTETHGSVFLFAYMTDVVIANSNLTGSMSGTADDWVLRSSESERILIVDSWTMSHFRHSPRQSGATHCMVGITTPGYLDSPRRTKFINVTNYLGPTDQAAATSLDTDNMFYVDVDFVLDQPSNRDATVQFGGDFTTGYVSRRWVLSRVHWYVFDATVMDAAELEFREGLANPGETWTYGGPSDPGPARFFYSAPNAVAVPPPPSIVSPLVGTLPISDPRAL